MEYQQVTKYLPLKRYLPMVYHRVPIIRGRLLQRDSIIRIRLRNLAEMRIIIPNYQTKTQWYCGTNALDEPYF